MASATICIGLALDRSQSLATGLDKLTPEGRVPTAEEMQQKL
jgi:hypothetical protein